MRAIRLAATAVMTGSAVAVLGGAAAADPPPVQQLTGTVHLDAGRCNHGTPTGSYLAVTFGTRAIKNTSSTCGGGAVTLLSPSAGGLLTAQYSSIATSVFDQHALSLGTSSGSYFGPPHLYLVGAQVQADVRSVVVGYDGGQWPVGAEQAKGHYDARTHSMSLQWFSGESFTRTSAGTEVHLAGHFIGTAKPVAPGTTVQLGTASFGAGPSSGAADVAAAASSHHRGGTGRSHPSRRHGQYGALRAGKEATTSGSPKTFLIAEVLVLINLVSVVAVAVRRGRR